MSYFCTTGCGYFFRSNWYKVLLDGIREKPATPLRGLITPSKKKKRADERVNEWDSNFFFFLASSKGRTWNKGRWKNGADQRKRVRIWKDNSKKISKKFPGRPETRGFFMQFYKHAAGANRVRGWKESLFKDKFSITAVEKKSLSKILRDHCEIYFSTLLKKNSPRWDFFFFFSKDMKYACDPSHKQRQNKVDAQKYKTRESKIVIPSESRGEKTASRVINNVAFQVAPVSS